MTTYNCTVKSSLAPWVTTAVVQQSLTCVFGAIGNAISVWCLIRCKRTNLPTKAQLLSAFGMILASCIITQPIVTCLYYLDFFCRDERVSLHFKFIASACNSILLQMERMTFTVVAVFRMVAVCWPSRFKKWLTLTVVARIQGVLFLCLLAPWLVLGIIQEFKLPPGSGTVMNLKLGDSDSAIYRFIMSLYVCLYLLPFLVTLVAYLVMIISLVRQGRQLGSSSEVSMEKVVLTMRLIILVNLVLDGPHILIHLFSNADHGSIISHMLFFLHHVLDPAIFVGMNSHYRRAVREKLQLYLPCLRGDNETDDGVTKMQDSVELRATHHLTKCQTEVRFSRKSLQPIEIPADNGLKVQSPPSTIDEGSA